MLTLINCREPSCPETTEVPAHLANGDHACPDHSDDRTRAEITDHRFWQWYGSLRAKWSGVLIVVGDYAHGIDEIVVRNADGEEMAVQRRHLTIVAR